MATHSSVLSWRIPGTGEPDGLLSMGSHSRTQLKRLSSSSSSSSSSSEENNLQKGEESEKPSEMWEGLKRIPGWCTFLPMSTQGICLDKSYSLNCGQN